MLESGELTDEALTSQTNLEATRVLSALPGIGRWSAALILLRGMRRSMSFLPATLGPRAGSVFYCVSGPALARVIDRFGEQRGYLYFCALGGALLAKGIIQPAPPFSRA